MTTRDLIVERLALNAVGSKFKEHLHRRLKGKFAPKGLAKPAKKAPRAGAMAPPASRMGPGGKTMPGGQPGSPGAIQAKGQGISPAATGAQTSEPTGQGATAPTAQQPASAAGEYSWRTDKERRGRKSGRDPKAKLAYDIEKLAKLAEEFDDYKDWYKECQGELTSMFDGMVDTFRKILTATSQAATVKANVGLALKAYRQLLNGEMFAGFMGPVKDNLDRIKKGLDPIGPKIAEYGKALTNETGIPVDRHIFQLMFHTRGSKPSEKQIEQAKEAITETANRLGWKPSMVQAALWAAHIVKTNEKAETYHDRLRTLHEQGKLKGLVGVRSGG